MGGQAIFWEYCVEHGWACMVGGVCGDDVGVLGGTYVGGSKGPLVGSFEHFVDQLLLTCFGGVCLGGSRGPLVGSFEHC